MVEANRKARAARLMESSSDEEDQNPRQSRQPAGIDFGKINKEVAKLEKKNDPDDLMFRQTEYGAGFQGMSEKFIANIAKQGKSQTINKAEQRTEAARMKV